MPGFTESEFWERAGTLDTKAAVGKKDDPAHAGWDAMKSRKDSVPPGWINTLQRAMLRVLPSDMIAEINAKVMTPGSASK
ncbi:MAG: hypothetical protein ACRYG8_15945 [Janthinobacterium lividum]